MKTTFLDFEQPIAELEAKIEELRFVQDDSAVDISEEIARLEQKNYGLTRTSTPLTPWQCALVARHPQRPYTLDYVEHIFTDFWRSSTATAVCRRQGDCRRPARFNGQPCMVIGHQKGRDTKEKDLPQLRHTAPRGLPQGAAPDEAGREVRPAGFTFIDTPGAYPGIDAEERGQSEAIGRNLFVMAELKVPIICTVIGEGGSGGALAIAVGDQLMMLQYSTYSVISPEGCASILWKSAERAPTWPETMGITACASSRWASSTR